VPADEPLLADGEVRWKGQVVAAVAAESEALALAAVDAIDVRYEERPALFDIRRAFDDDAPEIHQWGNVYPHFGPYNHRRVRKGDLDAAFEQADVIVEGVYRPQAIEHCPMETQVGLAVPEANGRLTIYSCTQAMYFSLGVVAAHLEWPLNRIKFVGGTVGGGFGGKVDTATETVCALLAIKAERPVKWRFTREEEFLCSSTRAPWHIEIRDAVTDDGWLLGRRMLTLHDAGAYSRFSPYGLTKHAFHHTGAYTIPNLHFDGFVVFTNRVPTTAMRGFGVTSVSLAVETHLNRVADVLGLDPYELRLKNANRIGDTTGNRVVMHDPSTVAVTLAAAERVGHELGAEFRAMTSDRRTGDLLPEHLVEQQAPDDEHLVVHGVSSNGGTA
jgi:CO/xanthine dehydrogenase Mo-binding subunit